MGAGFAAAGLSWARRHLDPSPARVRLGVAAWTERAIRAYERAGFARGARFRSATRGAETGFLLMTAAPPPLPPDAHDAPDDGQCVP